MWKLNGTLIFQPDRTVIVGSRSIEIRHSHNWAKLHIFINAIKTGLSSNDLSEWSRDPVFARFIALLKELYLLCPYTNEYSGTSLERSYEFYRSFWTRGSGDYGPFRSEALVTIIGCGGLGANLVINLALSGMRRFHLIDHDVVAISNLNRQHTYRVSDIGHLKVDVLAEQLRHLVPNVWISTSATKIISLADIDEVARTTDFVVGAFDSPVHRSQRICANHAHRKNVPVIFGTVGYRYLVLGPLLVSADAKQRFLRESDTAPAITAENITGSNPATNALLSALVSCEILKYFYGWGPVQCLNKRIMIDPLNIAVKRVTSYED